MIRSVGIFRPHFYANGLARRKVGRLYYENMSEPLIALTPLIIASTRERWETHSYGAAGGQGEINKQVLRYFVLNFYQPCFALRRDSRTHLLCTQLLDTIFLQLSNSLTRELSIGT
jgi:hypothetical protein